MDSDALNTFLTVHRRGGISNAAKALHRSQPAISRRIALLEQELGVPLFDRVAGRTMLSDAGRVMVPYAERAVAAAQDAENAVRALARPNSGPVALAVVGTLAGGRLSTIMKRFASEHPDVNFTLRTATSAEVSALIRRGEATIGLRYDRDRSGDLDCELLIAEPLQVVCAPDHARAGRRVARLADLRGERWIAFPELPGRREISASHVFALFPTHGLGEIEWTPVDSLTAQKRLVEAGFGIALLSQSDVAEELGSSAIATIGVRDLAASRRFYEKVIGLILTAEEDDTLYYRGVEEACHHSLVLRKGADVACARLGLRVFMDADLDKLKAFFEAHGCTTAWAEVPHQGRTLHAAVAALLHRFRDVLFMPASGDEGSSVRCPTHSQALKETAARYRHEDSSFSYRRLPM